MNKYVDEFIHACHIPKLNDGTDAVVVKAYRHFEDGSITPVLITIDKPERYFWVTKPGKRNHEFKKERESFENLDKYRVHNYRLADELNKVLNGDFGRQRYQSIAKLCNSPYVYGADVSIETLIKHAFQTKFEKSGLKPVTLTTGFLDIETDAKHIGKKQPNIITVTHENKVYTAILDTFLTVKQPDGSFQRGNLNEFIEFSKKTLDYHINELLTDHIKKNPKSDLKKRVENNPFEYFYYTGSTILELVTWIWQQIHKNKTDFLGVWNIDFDIPIILNIIKENNASYEDIMCPPDLNSRFKYVRYQRDEKQVDSIFKKWHWLHATSYSQFIDSQNLYSILRTVKGKEISMKLNDILQINDLGGKLTFKDDDPETENMSEIDWHRYMQKNESYKYIVYNQFDCISLQLMEWKNNDISSMTILGEVSQLCKWTRQTRKVADSFYFNSLELGMVTASPGQNMMTEFDKLIKKVGGAVLRPERTFGIGMRIFSDRPDIVTMLHLMTGDVDFSQQYPTATIVGNISKETKISCGISIEGMSREDTLDYYSLIIGMRENAILIGQKYYNLDGYESMEEKFSNYLKSQNE